MEELSAIPAESGPPLPQESSVGSIEPKSLSMIHFASSKGSFENVRLRWENITFTTLVKDKSRSSFLNTVYQERKILNGLNGEVSTGELLAILGPTGSGKSSFLNVLSARVPTGNDKYMNLQGTVFVNGKKRNDEKFRHISAYVQQDDFLYAHMTVYETLLLSAHFFLPNEVPVEQKISLIESVINDLSLKKARDTIIGNEKVRGVSGGERRRTSIAVQMLTDPHILFLDEPTSGLDAFQAQSVMESMKLLASLGRLVISVIHQPRSTIYNMFDKLLLLSEGRTMFMGSAATAVEYFQSVGYVCPEHFNPSDYFLDILSPDVRTKELDEETKFRINQFDDAWNKRVVTIAESSSEESKSGQDNQQSNDVKEIGANDGLEKTIRNFRLLCWRTWTEQSRNVGTIAVKLITTCFFALLLGGIYSNIGNDQKSIQNRNGLLFFVTINQAIMNVLGVLNAFPKEKFIVNRERSGRAYNTLSYFVAKFVVEIPLNVLPTLIYSLILYWMVGLNPDGDRAVIFIFLLMFIALSAISFGLAVSSLVPSVDAANALGTPLLMIGILFGGFYISVGNLPIVADWIPYFSLLRWGFEALTINEYKGLTFTCDDAKTATSCIRTGEQELQILNFDHHTTSYPIFGLGMVLLGFLCVSYIFLELAKLNYIEIGHTGPIYSRYMTRNQSTDEKHGISLTRVVDHGDDPGDVAMIPIPGPTNGNTGSVYAAVATDEFGQGSSDKEVNVKVEEVYRETLLGQSS